MALRSSQKGLRGVVQKVHKREVADAIPATMRKSIDAGRGGRVSAAADRVMRISGKRMCRPSNWRMLQGKVEICLFGGRSSARLGGSVLHPFGRQPRPGLACRRYDGRRHCSPRLP